MLAVLEEIFLKHFAMGPTSILKAISTDGGHLGWLSGLSDMIT